MVKTLLFEGSTNKTFYSEMDVINKYLEKSYFKDKDSRASYNVYFVLKLVDITSLY